MHAHLGVVLLFAFIILCLHIKLYFKRNPNSVFSLGECIQLLQLSKERWGGKQIKTETEKVEDSKPETEIYIQCATIVSS